MTAHPEHEQESEQTGALLSSCSALIPVKALAAAKGRLAGYLTPAERAQLVLTMLHHVVTTLQATGRLSRIVVVSADERVRACAVSWGAEGWPEAQPGHNAALEAAARRLQAEGVAALLTISADLPWLKTEEVAALLAQAQRYPVVLVPAHDGQGTNALLLRPPLLVPYLFGEQSLQRYCEAAQRRRLAYRCYESPGLALDIDTPEDLQRSGLAERWLSARSSLHCLRERTPCQSLDIPQP
ncbi:2-phospho-L-lactate guanylyltransferase [Thermogemmatispora carboxidivorans]|uniref:2-phospho-L-lactate guanylyltransferase n=1 Tax=Thermogemmatispora carboxidivorans TaxID=1382306 RepID=UPI00069CA30F|nr:2-phospho-L-lactate guanylyltransferase [Thermogemmatispora carboxidivorans]